MITTGKIWTVKILSSLLILVLVIVSLVLYILFSYLFTYMLESLGLDPQTSTFSGQIMIIVIILLLVAGARLGLEEDCRQDNVEAAL